METAAVARLIEDGIEGAEVVEIERTPHPGEDEYDHFAVTVVAPPFADEPIVARHRLVHDALGERMTTDIHALDVTTHTPAEWADREG
jgi:stress-induced morphogen